MERSRSDSHSGSFSRRSFLKSASLGVCSTLVIGDFHSFLNVDQHKTTDGASLSLHPDAEPGFFSIRYGGALLLDHAFIRVETETGLVASPDKRFTLTQEENALFFRDTRKECDLVFQWKMEEGGSLCVFGINIINRMNTPLRVKNIFPIITEPSKGKGWAFWQSRESRQILNDEWERCYGAARVRNMGNEEPVQSAWDMHLFDLPRRLTCSMSYYDIPNTKLSFTLVPRKGAQGVDLAMRADAHAGSRGVRIPARKMFKVNPLMIRMTEGLPWGALESYARLIAKRNRVAPPPIIPVGWVDWYFSKAQTTENDVMENLDFIERELKDFGLEYIQIDSGWQLGVEATPPPHNVIAGGPWVPNSKFPRGMKWFADEIRKRGLKPGIWVRPFHIIDGAKERLEHPDWFNDRGQMDCSNPEVRTSVQQVFRKLTEEWGYEYVKYDFPSFDLFGEWGPKLFADHVAQLEPHDQSRTNIESYRNSLKVIADTVRGKAHLLACNSVMPPTLGLAEVFRIGDDVGDWNRTFTYGVKSVSARYYTNGAFWTNDPDCLLVREPFTMEQAQMWGSLIALSGGAVFVSEYLSKLPAERLEILKKVMPVYRNAKQAYGFGRPLDLFENDPPQVWSLDVEKDFGGWTVVGLFNWTDKEIEKVVDFDTLGLDPQSGYHLFDFWGSRYRGASTGSFKASLPPQSCVVLSLRRVVRHPIVLSTTRHITQGGVDLVDVRWDEKTRTLSGSSLVVRNNPYEVIIHRSDKGVEQMAGGAQRLSEDGDILRIGLTTDRTGEVRWGVTFR